MRPYLPSLALAGTLVASGMALAGGYSRVHLVPALKPCPGPANCTPRQFESAYTFDTIVLRTPAGRYPRPGKPTILLEVRGVRDPSGAPVTGNLRLRVTAGRVSLPAFGTFPDDSPLVQLEPVPVPIEKGANPRFVYQQPTPTPAGAIVNGGGVEIYDPEGHLLAVTGSQAKP